MTSISGDTSSVTGAPLTPTQQADEGLFGAPGAVSSDETPAESADATLLDITGGSSGAVASDLAADVPPDLTAASALVSDLAGTITQQGSEASSVYSLLSAESALKLTS